LSNKIGVLLHFLVILACDKHVKGELDEMNRDRPGQPANRNCYRLSHISWALAQISCLLLLCRLW